jgi:NADH:ubiquinone oxidoreductase subunit K
LTCSGIDALSSFIGTSTISSSSGFVVEGVLRKSGVVHSSKMVNPVLFLFGSRVVYSRNLQVFLMTSLLILFSLVYPLIPLRKRISAASRRFMSRFVVIRVSLPYSSVGLAITPKTFS